ncbi:MAG: MbnP family protein [Saprospiraceae bacterium]
MNSRNPKRLSNILKLITYHLSLLVLISSCYTPTEGCLNIDATNYNASADEPCDDCCTFPNLNLKITHSITTQGTLGQDSVINHSADSTFNNVDDNFFQIKGMEFYLSDFQLVMLDGSVAEVEDEMTFMIYEDAISQISKDTTVKDDFVLVTRNSFNYTIGEFRKPGIFTELRFTVGIDEKLSSIDVDTLASSHPLSSENLMHFGTRDSGFVYQEFSLVADTSTNSTEVEVYQMGKETTNSIQLSFLLTGELEPGFDAEIPLRVNYSTWLKGINFASNDIETIKSIIVSNTAEAFEIGE